MGWLQAGTPATGKKGTRACGVTTTPGDKKDTPFCAIPLLARRGVSHIMWDIRIKGRTGELSFFA